jgi:predicted Zn-dependent peptidase
MAKHEFIEVQKGFYSSYWDTGLYGNYFVCEPSRFLDVIKLNTEAYANYAAKISDEELERTKRRVYNEVLHHESQNDISQSIANNLMYYNRRVHTRELAERVACVTADDLKKISEKVYKDMDVAVC